MFRLILLVLLLVFADIYGVDCLVYNEATLLLATSINKESVKMKVEKMIVDMIFRESKIMNFVRNLKIIVIKFKVCQILTIGFVKVREMMKIRAIRILV